MTSAGIDWKQVEQKGQTVILDFRNVLHDETKRFAMLWIFLSLFEFLKQRGRSTTPFVVTIDEFAALTQQVTAGVNPLAVLLDEFINQYMRNNNIWLTLAHQSIYQLDDHLRNTVLSLGNMVVGRVATINS
jgi:type IV secretory pathway VirB4 component